jgi:hypothetical protein
MEVSGQVHAPAALPPGKDPVTHKILDGLQSLQKSDGDIILKQAMAVSYHILTVHHS